MRSFELVAPSRLHFGMLSFGSSGVRQFGGLGAMVDAPGLRLRLTPSQRLECRGPLAERVSDVAQRVTALWPQTAAQTPCLIEVLSCPAQHTGLGVGTQLSLAVAKALAAWYELEDQPIERLAQQAGRGLRSAVGLHGFDQGGLLLEAGQRESGSLGVLLSRVALPETWRFVLIRPEGNSGLAGEAERLAFEQLPPVPQETTDRLCRLAVLELIPAAVEQDFDVFSESLFEFGRIAGSCFAAQQHGAFATEQHERIVKMLHDWGVAGVGQSSWGPTLFALVNGDQAAGELQSRLRGEHPLGPLRICLAAPNNVGARVLPPM